MTPAAFRGLLWIVSLALIVAGAWLLVGLPVALIVCGFGLALIAVTTYPRKRHE